MDMSGEQRIEAPRELVWAALNDPEVLRHCIPGCQELNKTSDTEMNAVAVIKVGPVSATFKGAVTLTDLDPPNGYRITGEGQGGVAGFAKGVAAVRLAADGDGTILTYTVSAQIGGKLSQLGGRLVDATARRMSDAFFKRFAEEIAATRDGASDGAAPSPSKTAGSPGEASKPRPSFRPQAGHAPRPAAASAASWSVWLNTAVMLAAVAVMGTTFVTAGTRAGPGGVGGLSQEILAVLELFLLLAVGYLIGRQHEASRQSALDRQLLLTLLDRRA